MQVLWRDARNLSISYGSGTVRRKFTHGCHRGQFVFVCPLHEKYANFQTSIPLCIYSTKNTQMPAHTAQQPIISSKHERPSAVLKVYIWRNFDIQVQTVGHLLCMFIQWQQILSSYSRLTLPHQYSLYDSMGQVVEYTIQLCPATKRHFDNNYCTLSYPELGLKDVMYLIKHYQVQSQKRISMIGPCI